MPAGTDFNAIRGRSLFRDAMNRFLRNKAAMASVVILVLIIAFVLFGPLFSQWSNEESFRAFIASEQFAKVTDWGKEQVLAGRPEHVVYRSED